jgi:very-short-patch-repair endonuclease
MAPSSNHAARALARRQQNNLTRKQLLELGYSHDAIRHRLATGRLHPVFRGVYAVDRPHVLPEGVWMAAVLRFGVGAVLSHESAAALWGFRPHRPGLIEISIPAERKAREPGIRAHRTRTLVTGEVGRRKGIPVTSPIRTLIDIAPRLAPAARERAMNEADRLGLTDPERVRAALAIGPRRHLAHVLRDTIDRRTFTKTRSDLERDFIPLARAAGLPKPFTQQIVNGYEVDFYWPDLGLVVESDGLRYHRTPARQAKDRRRDQTHTAAGLTPLRFTDEQIDYEQPHVVQTLRATAQRLAQRRGD